MRMTINIATEEGTLTNVVFKGTLEDFQMIKGNNDDILLSDGSREFWVNPGYIVSYEVLPDVGLVR